MIQTYQPQIHIKKGHRALSNQAQRAKPGYPYPAFQLDAGIQSPLPAFISLQIV
jgi:hypothetical protein